MNCKKPLFSIRKTTL